MPDFDSQYNQTEHLFGREPESSLRDHWHFINPALPLLDIGAGQGRNGLFAAREGLRVDAIDPSTVAVDLIRAQAETEGLPVRTVACGYEDFDRHAATQVTNAPDPAARFGPPYGAVLVFGLIQILRWEAIHALSASVHRWLDPGGLVFVTAFTTSDPSYAKRTESDTELGAHSFANRDGDVRTYLEPDQILDLFRRYDPVHHWEGMGPEHRHGTGPIERHAMVEAVLRKPWRPVGADVTDDCTRPRGA